MLKAGIVEKGTVFHSEYKTISFKGLTDQGLAGALVTGSFTQSAG
jgi:hypothetical protein